MATNKETPGAGTLGEPDYSTWSIDEIFAEFRRTQQAINEQSYTPEEVDALLREVTRGLGKIQLKPTSKSLNTSHRDCRLIRPAQGKGNHPLRTYRIFTKLIDIISELGKKISRNR